MILYIGIGQKYNVHLCRGAQRPSRSWPAAPVTVLFFQWRPLAGPARLPLAVAGVAAAGGEKKKVEVK
jgi:hypothetical protein